MDAFTCPGCGLLCRIEEEEIYEVYAADGKETLVTCARCGKDLIVTSTVTGWDFNARIDDE